MPFDWEKALAAGYSLDDISAYLFGPNRKKQATPQKASPGMLEPGNIDLHSRPTVRNPDGSISTVRSASFEQDGREVLVPTVSDDGRRILSDEEAWQQYLRTGKHLGKFANPTQASAYAQQLHRDQEREYVPRGLSTPGDYSIPGPEGRAPAPPVRQQPFVGPRTPVDIPQPEQTFQGTMERMSPPDMAPQYMGGPIQIGSPPDPENLFRGIENVQGRGSQRALGVSQLGRFALEAAAPAIAPAMAARPLSTLAGLAYGAGGQHFTEEGLKGLGVQPGYAQFFGDLVGLGTGAAAGMAPWERFARKGEIPQFMRNELGEITYRPSEGWTSTLRDLIEQKAPAKIKPEQLKGIASQAPKEELQWSNLSNLMQPESTTRYTRPVDETNLVDILTAPTETVELPLQKGRILEQFKGPPIQEVLRTPPDTKFSTYTLPGGEKSQELLFTIPREVTGGRTHTTPHWPEENVFAHVRFNDRLSPEGKKVLFLEELQSDWHQAGREKGYQRPLRTQEEMKATPLGEWGTGWEVNTADGRFVTNVTEPNLTAEQAVAEAQRRLREEPHRTGSARGVPDAPFKKDWHELLMKRMLKEAVDKGYDKLAWTTGEQQAARYDLSKHVKEIEYIKRGDKYELGVTQLNGEGLDLPQKEYGADELADVFGKEIAQKILDGEGKQYRGHEGRSLEGLDLKVGGEGMKGFYDKILPDFARKYGKKFGATVTQDKITGPGEKIPVYEGPQYDVRQFEEWMLQKRRRWDGVDRRTPEGWRSWNVTLDRQAQRVYNLMRAGATLSEAMAKEAGEGLATELGGKIREAPGADLTFDVHSIDITPAMREAIKERGQPMFGTTLPAMTKTK